MLQMVLSVWRGGQWEHLPIWCQALPTAQASKEGLSGFWRAQVAAWRESHGLPWDATILIRTPHDVGLDAW